MRLLGNSVSPIHSYDLMKRKTKQATIQKNHLLVHSANPDQTIAVGTETWFAWLMQHDKFHYQDDGGSFSARREKRRDGSYWYAYRKRTGKLRKAYLGKSSDLTPARLAAVSIKLAGRSESGGATNSAGLDASVRTAVAEVISTAATPADPTPFALMPSLLPPVLPDNLIVRERLLQRMTAPIALITTPGGFGKTTLLNQWQRSCPWPVAWVSLVAVEYNPYTFWSVIVVAFHQVAPELSQTVGMQLQSPAPPPIEQIIARLLKNLNHWREGAPKRRLTLILDNYQRAQSPTIDATCQLFLDRLPQGVQVIMASQRRFPFAKQRWRSKGVLDELTTGDLRLTPAEGVAQLEQVLTVPLSFQEKTQLTLQAQGWSAGLNLLALALRDREDVHRFITAFDGQHPYLQSFFVEEIFNGQPQEVQEFLLMTSLLKNLTVPLCNAVTGGDNAAELLQHLHQSNQFVSLVDDAQGVYQYQNLFAQALHRLLQERLPEQIPKIHRRAAAWYRENSFYSDAVQHLVAIEAWSEVATIIEHVVLDEMRRGSDHRILRWTQSLPVEVLQQHPILLATYVRLARQAFPSQDIAGLLGRLGSGILSDAPTGSLSEHDRNYQSLWELLDPIPEALAFMGQGQIAQSEVLLSQIVRSGKESGFLFPVMVAGGALATLAAGQGKLRQGESIAQDVLQWAITQTGGLPASASVALSALANIYYARNELSRARHYLNDAFLVDPNPTSANSPLMQHVLMAYILSAQGDSSNAHTTLEAALELDPDAISFLPTNDLKTHQALLYIRQGNLRMAERILVEMDAYPLQSYQIRNRLLKNVWAEFFLVSGRHQIAEDILTRSNESVFALFSPEMMAIYEHMLLAVAYWGANKINQAQRALMSAVRLAQPEGALRPFLDRGAAMIPLLSFVVNTGKLIPAHRHFIAQLLDELRSAHPTAPELSEQEAAYLTISAQITAREQEMLRLLKLGLSNKELATQMVVSESTVRTHLRNIYRKLGVHNRVQALSRARELRLL